MLLFRPDERHRDARPGFILASASVHPRLRTRAAHPRSRRRLGIAALDAPVSGGDLGARNATLTIMVGGDKAAFETAGPVFDTMGKTVILQGGPGAGQHTKMANQIAIAGNLSGAVETVTYARAAGLDPRVVLQSIAHGSASSWQLGTMVPRMLDGDFAPGFYAKHFLKDLRIALDATRDMGVNLPMLRPWPNPLRPGDGRRHGGARHPGPLPPVRTGAGIIALEPSPRCCR